MNGPNETFVGLEKALRESSREHMEQQQKMQEEMFRWEERNEQKAHERQLELLQVISNMFRPANPPASTAQTQDNSNYTMLPPLSSSSGSTQPPSSFHNQYCFSPTATIPPPASSPLPFTRTPASSRPSSSQSQFNTYSTITPSTQPGTLRLRNNAIPPPSSSPLPFTRTPASTRPSSSSESRFNMQPTILPSPQPGTTLRQHNTPQDNGKKGIHQPWFQL
ncbi:glycoprotein gp100-like [Anneissia japonica]|uniref:glycoprotein gp100-like n=1 Tax=Anneissia japonica TaxID=1529436 RepID=UPI001425AB78|nr:glycoprotein gp100-like [Anneissia japonica]